MSRLALDKLRARGALRVPSPGISFAAFFLLLSLRHPGMPFNAEFWGEDGWIWYPDAYNYGFRRLFQPHTGYLQTISRLIGLLAQPVPLTWAPFVFATTALAVQAAVATYVLSPRLTPAWPSLRGRALFALLYVALPNSWEVYGNVTNIHWHLGLLAFLVLVSAPAATWGGRVWDSAVLLLSGVSGPFCIFLLPIALWEIHARRDRTTLWRGGLIAAAVCTQAGFLLSASLDARPSVPLQAGPRMLARIVSMQVVLGAVLGEHWMHRYVNWRIWQNNLMPVAVLLGGTALCVVACLRGRPILRKPCVAGGLVLTAGLLKPNLGGSPPWPSLATPATGARYFVLPMLAWVGVLLTLSADRLLSLRAVGIGALAIMIVNLPGDWFYPNLPATGFQDAARAFERAPPGVTVKLGINPYVQIMTLTRH